MVRQVRNASGRLKRMTILNDESLDVLFRAARSQNAWTGKPVSDALIHTLYGLLCMGPTSANSSPARFLFVKSHDAKQRLAAHVSDGNKEKTLTAPVCAIIGFDLTFYDKLPQLFPHNPEARSWFSGDKRAASETAFRNGTLQGAYLIMAARALGLDCGPMSGFDNEGVDKAFFPDGVIKSNFLCGIGHGDPAGLFPRSPRLTFDEACEIL